MFVICDDGDKIINFGRFNTRKEAEKALEIIKSARAYYTDFETDNFAEDALGITEIKISEDIDDMITDYCAGDIGADMIKYLDADEVTKTVRAITNSPHFIAKSISHGNEKILLIYTT